MELVVIFGIMFLAIIPIVLLIIIIRAICKYLAKETANAFQYDYLAKRIAEETCKRLLIIEKQRAVGHAETTNSEQESKEEGNEIG